MVTLDQIKRGVASYYEAEFCQKATGLGKFAAYFVMPSLPGIIDRYMGKLDGLPVLDGIKNADGLFDMEAAKDRAMTAMQHCGNVELMGYRLNADDVEKLYRHIMEA